MLQDGRVVFMLPWQNYVIVGTTDVACEVTNTPAPTEQEIAFILSAISDFLQIKVKARPFVVIY